MQVCHHCKAELERPPFTHRISRNMASFQTWHRREGRMSVLRACTHTAAPCGLAAGMTVPGKSIHSSPWEFRLKWFWVGVSLEPVQKPMWILPGGAHLRFRSQSVPTGKSWEIKGKNNQAILLTVKNEIIEFKKSMKYCLPLWGVINEFIHTDLMRTIRKAGKIATPKGFGFDPRSGRG